MLLLIFYLLNDIKNNLCFKKTEIVPSYFSLIFHTVYCSVTQLSPSLWKYVDNNMVSNVQWHVLPFTLDFHQLTAVVRRRSWVCCKGSKQMCVSFKSRSMLGGSHMRTVWASSKQEMLRHHQTVVTLTTLIHLWAKFWTLQIFTWMYKFLESSDSVRCVF